MSDPIPPGITPSARPAPVPAGAPWVTPVTLAGSRVRVEPLERSHLPGLVAAGADPATWTWIHAPLTDEASMRAWVEDALRARDAGAEMPFATVDATSGRVLGSTRFMSIAPAHRRLEIGWTWLAPAARGTGANSEAKLLMLEHAFERLGAMRVEFKTDALNVRSRAALAGIGATFEGIFRRHQLTASGRVRDSAWYAITDEDWPAVRDRLQARLAGQAAAAQERARLAGQAAAAQERARLAGQAAAAQERARLAGQAAAAQERAR